MRRLKIIAKISLDALVNQFLDDTRLIEPKLLPQDIVRDVKDERRLWGAMPPVLFLVTMIC